MGEMIDFQSVGENYSGYFARAASGKGRGVVVIQEYWGLVGHIKSVTDRFAEADFNALAPDFYQGKTTEEPDEAGSMMMALQIDHAEQVLHCAVDRLLAEPTTTGDKVGVVGFCMGGQLSLFAATINPKIGACVDFYGIHPHVHPKLENLQGPLLGLFAEHDDYAPPASVKALAAKLDAAGAKYDFRTYPGTQHAFFNDDRPEVYDKIAAEDAWRRTVAFLRANL